MPENLHKWLLGVDEKLSKHDGLQLLKILYYKEDIFEGELDAARKPTDIYTLSKRCQNDDVRQAIALLIHRLTLLVPRSPPTEPEDSDAYLDPDKLYQAKDLGAKACLDYLEDRKCQVVRPAVQVNDLISPESRLLECLVTAYVNVSPRKRKALRRELANRVGVHPTQFDLFNLICKLLRKGDDDAENIGGEFVNALNNVEVPEPVYEHLRQQLNCHSIPHTPFSTGDLRVQKETEDDYISETAPLLGGQHHHHHHNYQCTRMCIQRGFFCCLITFIPIALFAVAICASTPTLSAHNHSQKHTFDVSNNHLSRCTITGPISSPLIHLGTIDGRWYSGVWVDPDKPTDDYVYTELEIFTVPSEKVVEYSQQFHCEKNGDYELYLPGIYLHKDTVMTFNVCIQSMHVDIPGSVNISFYDDYANWTNRNDGGTVFKSHQFYVNANETKSYNYRFVSTHDSFYYIMFNAPYQSTHAFASFYSVYAEMKHVNSSDWLRTSHKSVCEATPKECSVPLPKDNAWVFSTKQYDIFGRVTAASEDKIGHLSVRPEFRMTAYAIPTVIGLIVLVPLETVFVIFALCYCYYFSCKQTERNQKIQECREIHANIQ